MKIGGAVLALVVVVVATTLVTTSFVTERVRIAVNDQRDRELEDQRIAEEQKCESNLTKLASGKHKGLVACAKSIREARTPRELADAIDCYACTARGCGEVIFQDGDWSAYAVPAKYCNRWYAVPVAGVVVGGGSFGANPAGKGLWFENAKQEPGFTQDRVMLIRYQYINGLAITPVRLSTREPYRGPCPGKY